MLYQGLYMGILGIIGPRTLAVSRIICAGRGRKLSNLWQKNT